MRRTSIIRAAAAFVLLISPIDAPAFAQAVMCPDGTDVASGPCHLCPNGKYIGGSTQCALAPDGSYIPGNPSHPPQLAPDGTYVPGGSMPILCPNGQYVTGKRCVLMPDGSYVGQN
jgi:hypothetical protein